MLLEATFFYATLAAIGTLACLPRGLASARFWVGMPIAGTLVAGLAWVFLQLGWPQPVVQALAGTGALAAIVVRLWQRHWSWTAALLYAAVVLGTLSYLSYAAVLTFAAGLGWIGTIASAILLLLEIAALSLAASYLFEILDRLGAAPARLPPPPDAVPTVAIQVPCYNEPVEVVSETLRSLANLDYPKLTVQVVDNNTPDAATWRPLEKLCQELGQRFQFIHLEDWPGFKAGALNEATRRLPEDVEVLGIVDADYLVEPGWLKATAGYFDDQDVAFVQSPQDYRDWEDDGYLRGLYHSYRYFFDVTMPVRARRNAIIFAGTMGLIRRNSLDAIGGWNADIVTEDAEASLRMLELGLRGVYVHRPFGRGLMPLDFDGLKKQRHRWALGGIQILRAHWRRLIGGSGRLTGAQRTWYLLGSTQWFGEVLMACFTLLLLATAIATAMHHQLPVRRLTGAVLAIPLAFLCTGVLRAVWAIRATSRCGWRDALNALRVWFALSWVVTLACLAGLVTRQAAFLRTPKRKEGAGRLANAVRACRAEAALTLAGVLGAAAMLVRAPSLSVAAIAALLLFQAFLYSNAPWASAAAEGIKLTPFRQAYRRSAQNTGEWPQRTRRLLAIPAAAGVFGAVALVLTALTAPTGFPSNPNPALAPLTGGPGSQGSPSPAPAASPAETTSPAPAPASPSPVAPSPAPTAT